MRYKVKGKKTTIVVLCIAVLFILAAHALGFNTTRTATRVGYTGHEWLDSWSGKYINLDGTMSKTIHTDSEPDTIRVEIVTESGSISITMTDPNGNVVFEKSDIETSNFDVDVSEKVKVKIEADNHKGSFSITSK